MSLRMNASLNFHSSKPVPELIFGDRFDDFFLIDPIEFLNVEKSAGNADSFRIEIADDLIESVNLLITGHAVSHESEKIDERFGEIAAVAEIENRGGIFSSWIVFCHLCREEEACA